MKLRKRSVEVFRYLSVSMLLMTVFVTVCILVPVTKKVKDRKHTWHKGYDAVTIANAHLDALEQQMRENNELLKKAIQQSEAAE